ncbi:hypothetical protein EDC96DRAFT_556591 [Choanephora cucurbitarum]|nr:hypothetical protein EDC96DRAFT_556591 [Choanephora cucurbitarum]
MATLTLKNRSPSMVAINTVATNMIEIPLPSVSITNKPSSGTSLYHKCRSVLDRLSLVEGMTYYLDYDSFGPVLSSNSSVVSSESTSSHNSNDPLSKLWDLCRRGAPLATLFNALQPAEPLKLDFTQTQQVNECKKTVYHFIVACRNQLEFKEGDLFTLSDLYKDNTNGFVKVVNTIDLVLQLLEEKGIISSHSSENRNSTNAPKDTRDKVVHELLETERKYVQDLEVLQNYMRELQMNDILNPDTIHYLFGNLNTLVDFQRRFLFQLEEIAEKSPEEQNFGLLFTQMEEQFTVYEPYCSNYFSAQDLVVQEAPKLQKLANILNPQYELPSMLIKPVQRICKYPLLLQQLIKSTQPDWPHFDDMETGLESVKRVTERVNETQRKHENIQVLDDLKRRMDDFRVKHIDNFGCLLLHDKLVIQQSDETEKEMFVFFFEKTLLICKETKDANKNKGVKANTISIKKKRRGSLQPKGLIDIRRILSVRNLSVGEGSWYLRVDWKDNDVDHVLFRFRNEEQVKLWESTLKRKISPIKSNVSNTQLASMKNAAQSVPASFRTDDEDEEEENLETDTEDEEGEFQPQQSRSRSNSISAHLFNTISGRPKAPRHNTDIKNQRYTATPLPRTSTSTGTHHSNDYSYPASPPPSTPSSPTSSSRTRTGLRDSSALVDIAHKFMSSDNDTVDEIKMYPPYINRSQSHSAATPAYPPTSTIPSVYHLQQLPRLRSQSSPNIHNQTSRQPQWEDTMQLPPFSSRTLYHMPPSPLDPPSSVRMTSSATTSPILSPNLAMPGALKIKLNYNAGIYVVMCPPDISFEVLMEKVDRKIRLIGNLQPQDTLRLRYQDEDGDLITINSNEDVQMAFESRGNASAVNLFVSV